jgi:hypothetical protein
MRRLIGPLENISIPQETVSVEVDRALPDFIDVSEPRDHEISVQIFSSSSGYPVAYAVINAGIFKWEHARGGTDESVKTPSRNPRLRSPDVIKSDGYFDCVWAIFSRHFQQVPRFDHNFWVHPRSLDVNQGIGTGFGSLGCQFCVRRLFLYLSQGLKSSQDSNKTNSDQQSSEHDIKLIPPIRSYRHGGKFADDYGFWLICLGWGITDVLMFFGCDLVWDKRRGGWSLLIAGIPLDAVATTSGFIGCLPWDWWRCLHDGQEHSKEEHFQNGITVTQKLLTTLDYCNTLITIGRLEMANVLSTDKQVAVIAALAEGSSIRSIGRITGVHRDTIMRLGARVGKGCQTLLDSKMGDLPCKQLQFDEIWGFIGKKERHCTPDDSPEMGDVWTFCAIDSDTKLVPAFKCGKRDLATANASYPILLLAFAIVSKSPVTPSAPTWMPWTTRRNRSNMSRYCTLSPFTSAAKAVRAAIIQEFRERGTEN